MEGLLNLLWLLVACLLCGTAVVQHRRGHVRLSLWSAVACSALLALLLFPALSMTDDLQRANLDAEPLLRHSAVLLLTALEALVPATAPGAAVLLLLLAAQGAWAGMILRRRRSTFAAETGVVRPQAVRPPPALA